MIENIIIIDGKVYPLISFTLSLKRDIQSEFMDRGYLEAKGINTNEYIITYFDKKEKEIILKFNPPVT